LRRGRRGRRPARRPGADGRTMSFAELWRELEPLGRDPGTGGYRRYSWTPADAECRAWFTRQADRLGLTVEQDRNGNLWAWWGPARENAVVTGSHLDSVPDGGAYDGPLGVASGLAAVAELKAKNFYPERAMAIAVFTEEEGARFRVACLGSRLITGVIDPETARGLSDDDGITLAAAMTAAGADPSQLGPDDDLLGRIGAFVELHVEQGRALAPMGAAIRGAESIWPPRRRRLRLTRPAAPPPRARPAWPTGTPRCCPTPAPCWPLAGGRRSMAPWPRSARSSPSRGERTG